MLTLLCSLRVFPFYIPTKIWIVFVQCYGCTKRQKGSSCLQCSQKIQPVGLKSLRETVLTYCLLHEQPKWKVLKGRVV